MTSPPVQRSDSEIGIGLLDFLFTVAVGIGLTPELLNGTQFKGMLSEPWVIQRTAPGPADWFNLGVVGLGLMTTVFSWFGYHRSIINKPVTETLRGMARFSIDVILILLYGLMMMFFQSFVFVLLLLVAVFWLYVVWDLIRAFEYWESYSDQPKLLGFPRYELIPFLWALLATVIFALTRDTSGTPWLALVAAAAVVFGFRLHKRLDRPRPHIVAIR